MARSLMAIWRRNGEDVRSSRVWADADRLRQQWRSRSRMDALTAASSMTSPSAARRRAAKAASMLVVDANQTCQYLR